MQTRRTNHKRTVRWLSRWMMFGALLTLIFPAGAWAAGTASGTTIQNQATISYSVSGVAQTAVPSSSASFVVDNVVRVVVANLANTAVAPLQPNMALAFTVTNTGNTTQGYSAEVINGTTNIPMTNVRIFLDVNSDGVYDSGDTLITAGNYISGHDLAPDTAMQLLIVANAPDI